MNYAKILLIILVTFLILSIILEIECRKKLRNGGKKLKCTTLLRSPLQRSAVSSKTKSVHKNRKTTSLRNPTTKTRLGPLEVQQLKRSCKRSINCCHRKCHSNHFSVTCAYPNVVCQCGTTVL